jgi:Fic family protein
VPPLRHANGYPEEQRGGCFENGEQRDRSARRALEQAQPSQQSGPRSPCARRISFRHGYAFSFILNYCHFLTYRLYYGQISPKIDNSEVIVVAIPGIYKRSLRGHRIFVPDPLPPKFTLSPVVARHIEEATYLLGQVEMCRTLLPNAELLIYGSLQREALASSTIEGTIASPDELIRFQASQHSDRAAVREVANYASALAWGREQIQKLPITSRLILGLHERLLEGVRGASNAGRFKDDQNRIGSHPSEPFEDAIFVPPAPEDTIPLMTALERYINLENQEPRVMQCALAHYQFETIHPFSDGNGRVGRLIIILQMMQVGLLSAPLIYPSVYFERTRTEYYQRLQDVREQGAWNEWIGYFATGIIQQCSETISFTQMILRLRERMQEEIGVRRRASLSAVLNVFFEHPMLSISQVAHRAHITKNSAQAALDELEARGIVYEVTGRQKGRVYACAPVLSAIFGSEITLAEPLMTS